MTEQENNIRLLENKNAILIAAFEEIRNTSEPDDSDELFLIKEIVETALDSIRKLGQ